MFKDIRNGKNEKKNCVRERKKHKIKIICLAEVSQRSEDRNY